MGFLADQEARVEREQHRTARDRLFGLPDGGFTGVGGLGVFADKREWVDDQRRVVHQGLLVGVVGSLLFGLMRHLGAVLDSRAFCEKTKRCKEFTHKRCLREGDGCELVCLCLWG